MGLNASRALSCLYDGSRLSAGLRPDPDARARRRAGPPRDRGFKSVPFFQVECSVGRTERVRLVGEKLNTRQEAERRARAARRVAVRDLQGRAQTGEVPRAQALRPHRAATRRIDARGPHRGGNAERAANAVREEAGDISQDREPLHRRVRHPRDGPRALGHRGAGNRRRGRRGRVRRVALRRRPRGRRLEGPRPRRDPAHGAARRQGDGGARGRRARPWPSSSAAASWPPPWTPRRSSRPRSRARSNGDAYTASGSTVTDASWIAVDEACRAALAGGRQGRRGRGRRGAGHPRRHRAGATPSPSPMATFA